MVRRIIGILFLLGIVAALVWYYGLRPEGDVVITGIVTTDDVIVSSQVAGRIQELKVREGSMVKKGDLVAIIESDTWQKDMAFYTKAEDQARDQVAQAEAAVRFQQNQLDSQIEQGKASVESSKASLEAAEAQIGEAKADLENAQLTFEHEEAAFKRGAESQQQYDQSRTLRDSQKARLEAVTRQRDVASANVEVSKSALDVIKGNTEQVAQKIAGQEMAKSALLAATAQKEKAAVELSYTEIRAPIDGIVKTRVAMAGEVVNPASLSGGAILTLIDLDDLWVRADVEESLVERMKLDDILPVKLPSGAVKEGRVFYRGVDADYATQRDVSRSKRDVKTFEVRLRCDNKDRAMAVGMTAYVTLPAQK